METSNRIQKYGRRAISAVEVLGLFVIAVATLIAAGQEVVLMAQAGKVRLEDLLMLFIYLEVIAMVGLYLESGQLPVRLPLYIGMVALARYLILDMKGMNEWRMLAVSSSVLLLALAVLVVRYGHVRYPYDGREAERAGVARTEAHSAVSEER